MADERSLSEKKPIALRLSNVEKNFGGYVAVDKVSLTVNQGEFLTLLGPSGCGKTTILRMVAGFETPSGGEIYIDGEKMEGVPPYRRPIGIVFQNLALFPHMTVVENISFGLEILKVPADERKQRVGDALALIGLSDLAGRRVHQISGGQKQRVALARALVLRPAVLLLDEPLGALDLKLRRQMQVELKRIQQQVGTTFIFVTHDQDEALTMSDRIAVMNQGKIEQLDEAHVIYERPTTAFVAQFIGDTNFIAGSVREVGGGTLAIDPDAIGIPLRAQAGAGSFSAGDRVSLSIRPENIRFAHTGNDLAVQLSGEVREIVYAGTHTKFTLMVKGKPFVANVPTSPSAPAHQAIGDVVAFGWDIKDAVVLTS